MELEKAIKILSQCTNDWNDLCDCCFKDKDVEDYSCVGCREKALGVILNHLTEQEKMINIYEEMIIRYEEMIIKHKQQLKKSGIYGYDYDLKILADEESE